MKVTLKLFASLAAHIPPEVVPGHEIGLDIEPGTTVGDLIRRRGIPEALCAIVLIDGAWVARADRSTRQLREGEVLSIWPPVAGG